MNNKRKYKIRQLLKMIFLFSTGMGPVNDGQLEVSPRP